MSNKIRFLIISALALFITTAWGAQPDNAGKAKNIAETKQQRNARLKWWRDARFGMFIHWGPVSLKGTEIGWSRGNQVGVEEYDSLYKKFNPEKFNAKDWVSIAKEAGMKYIVLTAKHHDGFCLWPSEYTDYDIANTPFKRDVIKELAEECAKQGIKFCTYYSILDWYHPDYNTAGTYGGAGFKLGPNESPDMDRYVAYMKGHLTELIQNYGPLGILWFDGEWEKPWTADYGDDIYQFVRSLQPSIIVNNRVSKGRQGMAGTTAQTIHNPGDYDTPEQTIGTFQNDRPWETCMTICRQWAWKPNDQMKSLKQCIRTLVRVAGGDGNFLFNVGPMPDGRIEPRQVARLKEMGAWLKRYGKSIYATRGGPYKPGPWGASTRQGNYIYLHILDMPGETLQLPPLPKEITGFSLITGGAVGIKQGEKSLTITVPKQYQQDIDTIVELKLDGSARNIPAVDVPSSSAAYNKKASASNIYQNKPEYAAAKAFDDNPKTRWATDAGTKQAWLEVDLGKKMTIDHAMIDESDWNRVKTFELQYKTAGEWKTAYKGTTIGAGKKINFDPVTARHIRLNITDATEGPTIWEFQLFEAK
jgi:alpha-L-fucosidase